MSTIVKPVTKVVGNVPLVGKPIQQTVDNLTGRIMQGVGLETPEDPYAGNLDALQARMEARAANPSGIVQAQYQNMAKEGLGNTLATIASQRSLRPSEQANLASRTSRDTQMDIAGKAGLLGLQEQQTNQDALANLLMARSGANLANQNAASGRAAGLAGAGISAIGKIYGGKGG